MRTSTESQLGHSGQLNSAEAEADSCFDVETVRERSRVDSTDLADG